MLKYHLVAFSPLEVSSFLYVLFFRDANDAEIKRAYRRLSLELHPDKVKAKDGDARQAEQLFQQINRAYQVLSSKYCVDSCLANKGMQ